VGGPAGGGPAGGGPAGGGDGGRARDGLRIFCFGHFELWLGDQLVDLSPVKPRARSVLRLLAVGGGAPVHRDELIGALWPDDDQRGGTRNLQVAISSLRQLLDSLPGPRSGPDGRRAGGAAGHPGAGSASSGGPTLVARDGDAYRLAVGPDDTVDVAIFGRALRAAGEARRRGDRAAEIAEGWVALGAYRGELLMGAGSADWVVERRERFRIAAAEVAQQLAAALLDAGDAAQAVVAAERGLSVDRFRDGLWRALVAALEANGDRAAAAKAAIDYEAVLAELGIVG
ncbi:MAG: AfsR/SARP family transcriptional regulator, partial [Acidimicrobiales bacterium]